MCKVGFFSFWGDDIGIFFLISFPHFYLRVFFVVSVFAFGKKKQNRVGCQHFIFYLLSFLSPYIKQGVRQRGSFLDRHPSSVRTYVRMAKLFFFLSKFSMSRKEAVCFVVPVSSSAPFFSRNFSGFLIFFQLRERARK